MPAEIKLSDFLFDVAVIGAGPSGLSAAVRSRFVKSRGAYPMSVIVFEASRKNGGLAVFGATKLTGPSLVFKKGELIEKLLKDVRKFDIPIIHKKVVLISSNEASGGFKISTACGETFNSRSVIISSGMRALTNESEFFTRGVNITCMGYDYIYSSIKSIVKKIAVENKKAFIYGGKYSKNLISFVSGAFKELGADCLSFGPVFVIDACREEFLSGLENESLSGLFLFAKINSFNGREKLESFEAFYGDKTFKIKADDILIDYNSFEISPSFDFKISCGEEIFDDYGFIKVDRRMRTPAFGLYASGDSTGPCYFVARALSSGAEAAFSAYEDITGKKIGRPASLFAYKALEFTLESNYREIDYHIMKDSVAVISKASKILRYIVKKFGPAAESNSKKILNIFGMFYILNHIDFMRLAGILSIGRDCVSALVRDMIDEKLLTIEKRA